MNGLADEMNRKIRRTRTTAIVINEHRCGSGTTNAIKRRDVTGSLSNRSRGTCLAGASNKEAPQALITHFR